MGTDNRPWARLTFPSIRAQQLIVAAHARTPNESCWDDPQWVGLGFQSTSDFDTRGIADSPLALMLEASAKLPDTFKSLAEPRAAVTGAVWSVPDVMAGVPLSARTRVRSKLAPINLRIAMQYLSGVDNQTIAPLAARLAKAIYAYTLAGGVVSLSVIKFGQFSRPATDGVTRAFIETKVNTSDRAEIALAFSVTYNRSLGSALLCALSPAQAEIIPRETSHSIPGKPVYVAGGDYAVKQALEEVIKSLAIV